MADTADAGPENIEYAGLGKRLIAALFDVLIILGYIVVLLGVGFGVRAAVGPLERVSPLFASPVVMDGVAFLTLILPVALYFALQEGSPRQATWGKRKAGIRVVDTDGNRLSLTRSLVRTLVKLLPWQIAHTSIFHVEGWPLAAQQPTPLAMAGFVLVYVLVGVYALAALISKAHRTPYDWAAGSYVIVDTR